MLAENRAMRMLILIPVLAIVLALLFSVSGLDFKTINASRPTGPSALVHAAVHLADAFYVTASGTQALLAERR